MSKYRGLFFTEAHEHIKKMGRHMLALEKDCADGEAIDALFREAHSLKGMAASMGFQRTADLSHRLEDILHGFRSRGEVPQQEVDRLFAGLDLLEGLVDDLETERPERSIDAFGAPPPPPEAASAPASPPAAAPGTPPARAAQPAAPEPKTLPATSHEATTLLQINLELTPDTSMPAARLLLIYNRLAQAGRVEQATPTPEELQQGGRHQRLQLRLHSRRPASQLEEELKALGEVARAEVVPISVAAAAPRREKTAERGRTVRVRTELLDRFINLAGEMISNRYQLQSAYRNRDWRDVRGGIEGINRLVTDLHHHVLKVRMMPLESITGHLPRLVRDLARKTGKQVDFSIEGEDVELDRAILEELADPLLHLLRNAVDHGVEVEGRVFIRAARERDLVLIEVADDGRGIDPEKIRAKALKRGLIDEAQARTMRDRDVLQLICRPGFSTAEKITATSGRGVGMDVVKMAVDGLGGSLEICSQPGAGTRIELRLPLSVAIIQVLLVQVDGHQVGIPITRVERILSLNREQIQSSGRRLVFRLDDEAVPLLSLRKILQLPGRALRGPVSVVLTAVGGRRVGLVVDALCGQREAFVKSLAYPLNMIAGVSGATILGDGSVLFLVDPQQLLDERPAARSRQSAGAEA